MAQQTDDFSTDPFAGTPRWTVLGQGFTWDSVALEADLTPDNGDVVVRYDTSPGSLEHEAQVTARTSAVNFAGPGTRITSAASVNGYGCNILSDGSLDIIRFDNGSRQHIANIGAFVTFTSGNFYTVRMAAEGGNGANVVLRFWQQNHGGSKPSDPGWIGVDGSPDATFTDTDANRKDDAAVDLHGGIAGRNNSDTNSQHDFWKARNISDRGGRVTKNTRAWPLGMGHGMAIGMSGEY